ncbi:MAG: hypothetical protein Q9218_002137 [Villophora microphyllina]
MFALRTQHQFTRRILPSSALVQRRAISRSWGAPARKILSSTSLDASNGDHSPSSNSTPKAPEQQSILAEGTQTLILEMLSRELRKTLEEVKDQALSDWKKEILPAVKEFIPQRLKQDPGRTSSDSLENTQSQVLLEKVQELCEDNISWQHDGFMDSPFQSGDQEKQVCVFQNNNKRYTVKHDPESVRHEAGSHAYPYSCNPQSNMRSTVFTIIADPPSDPDDSHRYEYAQMTDSDEEDDEGDDDGNDENDEEDEDDDEDDDDDDDKEPPLPVLDRLQDPHVFSMKTPTKEGNNKALPCLFMSLGWLIEEQLEVYGDRIHYNRPTNYVVLLNLSTGPISVWLLYDYHQLGYNRKCDYLSESTDERPFMETDEFENSVKPNDLIKSEWFKPFRELYINMDDLEPTFPKEESDKRYIDSGRGI